MNQEIKRISNFIYWNLLKFEEEWNKVDIHELNSNHNHSLIDKNKQYFVTN
jgi:hypothetical protein